MIELSRIVFELALPLAGAIASPLLAPMLWIFFNLASAALLAGFVFVIILFGVRR